METINQIRGEWFTPSFFSSAVISSSFFSSGGLGKGQMSSTFLPLCFVGSHTPSWGLLPFLSLPLCLPCYLQSPPPFLPHTQKKKDYKSKIVNIILLLIFSTTYTFIYVKTLMQWWICVKLPIKVENNIYLTNYFIMYVQWWFYDSSFVWYL